MNDATPLIPPVVLDALCQCHGRPGVIEPLGGLSGGRVFRVRWSDYSLILKHPGRVAEAFVYHELAPSQPTLRQLMPNLIDSWQVNGGWWLALEDIPRPLPRERWLADPEQMALLASLHELQLPQLPASADPYRPGWSVDTTEQALSHLPDVSPRLARALGTLRLFAPPLFMPETTLSGDPNPANWGIRADGSLVLFDWERLTRGHPAIDLAITVPGLGELGGFRQVAEAYESIAQSTFDVTTLTRQIAVAKVWSVVELLAQHQPGAKTDATIRWLVRGIPGWAPRLADDLGLPDR